MTTVKRILFFTTAVVAGVLVGLGATAFAIRNGAMIGRVDNDGWVSSTTIGSETADPYTRALVARIGLLGLNKNETIYFTKTTDEARRDFDGRCTYRVEGRDLPARWWAITLYAPDNFLAQNGQDRPSIDATSIQRDSDGRWTAIIAPDQPANPNWISSRNGSNFSLSIRLYNPEPTVAEDMSGVDLPTITRVSCPENSQ